MVPMQSHPNLSASKACAARRAATLAAILAARTAGKA